MNEMLKVASLFTVTITLVACATSSGVSQLGKDTFTLSAGVAGAGSVSGNDTKAKREALAEANAFCQSKGKEIQVQNIGTNSTYAGSTTEIIFQCLSSSEMGSAEKPMYRREPNVIIENRNR